MRPTAILSLLCSLCWMLACGGGSTQVVPAPTANLTLRLGSDSIPGYSQAVVSVEKVDFSTDGRTWAPLSNVRATVDLQAIQNGQSVVIVPSMVVSPATAMQFRITWATVNYQSQINQPAYVVPTGGSGQVLTMPGTTVISGQVNIPAKSNVVAQIMLNGQCAIQARAGVAPTFQATGTAYDLATSARIIGQVNGIAAPLNGIEVYAETVDGSGLATLVRRAMTDANGAYVLEGLPLGGLYFVVSQPNTAAMATHPAAAAIPVNASTSTTYVANLSFAAAQTPGSLSLTIAPPSAPGDGTWGELRQTLSTGGVGAQTLIVRSQAVTTGVAQDQVGFLNVAPGVYGVTAQRLANGASVPTMKVGSQVLVSSNALAAATLSYP